MEGMRLTREGKEALAQALTGKELKFTRVALGSGDFDYSAASVFDLTELKKLEMWLPLTKCEVQGDGTVYIEAFLSNAEVYQGFACREHGLFCTDPVTGKEILYSYVNVGNDYDFIPSNVGTAVKNIYLEYVIEIQDADNITAQLDLSVAYVNRDTFENHVKATNPHPNLVQRLDEVAETTALWVADSDNNLHKLKLSNLKKLLEEPADTAASATFQDLVKELGLDANLLILEDFTDNSTLDDFSVKVTSSAESGSLIGLAAASGVKTGAFYTISDGVNAETIQIKGVAKNDAGFRANLAQKLSYAYDFSNTFLYRTTPPLCDSFTVKWQPQSGFTGYEANIQRTLPLNDFTLEADAFLVDGFLTL